VTKSLYILGGPGSGKSTLMARLLRGWTPGPYVRLTTRELFGHNLLNDDLELGVYLGHLRPEYPGTDALSLSVAPQALIWLETLDPQLSWVFGEGARLGHQSFLTDLAARTDLLVAHLFVEPSLSYVRRTGRGGKLLSQQYCKTATTKAANTARWCKDVGINTVELDGSRGIEDLAEDIFHLG
jgi:hypothetical protein